MERGEVKVEEKVTNNLVAFTSEKDAYIKETKEVLQEAIEEGFEMVLIVGIKGDKVLFKNTASLDTVKKLGMIEVAKLNWYGGWK